MFSKGENTTHSSFLSFLYALHVRRTFHWKPVYVNQRVSFHCSFSQYVCVWTHSSHTGAVCATLIFSFCFSIAASSSEALCTSYKRHIPVRLCAWFRWSGSQQSWPPAEPSEPWFGCRLWRPRVVTPCTAPPFSERKAALRSKCPGSPRSCRRNTRVSSESQESFSCFILVPVCVSILKQHWTKLFPSQWKLFSLNFIWN